MLGVAIWRGRELMGEACFAFAAALLLLLPAAMLTFFSPPPPPGGVGPAPGAMPPGSAGLTTAPELKQISYSRACFWRRAGVSSVGVSMAQHGTALRKERDLPRLEFSAEFQFSFRFTFRREMFDVVRPRAS